MKFLILILTVTDDNILLKMKYKECNFMMTYKNLYCALVRSMSEAIDLYLSLIHISEPTRPY